MPVPLGPYVFALHLLYTVASPDNLSLTFSENPVYNGCQVTLFCRFSTNLTLNNVTVDAFNGTQRVGSLNCSTRSNITNTGTFSDTKLSGCPKYVPNSGEVNVSMIATSSLELEYNCSVHVNDGHDFYYMTSNVTRLEVRVLPSVVTIEPQSLVFNESDSVPIRCHSPNGKPSANVKLTVSKENAILKTTDGNDSVSWNVSVPRAWHNAVAICNVTNHRNATTNHLITVNHIALDHSGPLVVNTDKDSIVLNCSEKITVFPAATFKWSIPDGLLNANASSLSNPIFNVTRGMSGAFNCTATNNVTSKTVHVAYTAISTTQSVAPPIPQHSQNQIIWALAVMGFTIITIFIIIAIISILYKRGFFRVGDVNKISCSSVPSQQLNKSGCVQGDEMAMTENIIYDSFDPRPSNHAKEGRLLVAAEGAAANLKQKILPTTVLVEFDDRSYSLNGILAKIDQVQSSPSPTSFKSVALLLRCCETGLTISELDRAMLTSTSLSGAKDRTLHDFFTRLVDICLDRQASSGRIDVFNYSGRDSAKLVKRLTDLTKVNATVSRDLFGMDQLTENGGECNAVGDNYFDRSCLANVVYADIQPLNGRTQPRSRKNDDQVVYSEVELKA